MRNSCLRQSPPAASSAGALLLEAGISAKLVAHFRLLGRPLGPSGAAGSSVVPARPGVTPFLGGGHQRGVTPRPCSFGFGGGVRLPSRPSLSGGPRGRPARPKDRPGSGGGGGPGPWRAPPEWRGLLRGEGPGSTRGDGAPEEGALFGGAATLRTSFQPPAVPHPKPARQPCLFFQPRALHRDKPTVLGAARGRGPRQARVPLGLARELQPLRARSEGRRSSGPFWNSGAGVGQDGRWSNGAHGLGGRPRPESWAPKGAGGLRRRPPQCRRAPAPYPRPAESGAGAGATRGRTP